MATLVTSADIFNPVIKTSHKTIYWSGLHGCAVALAVANLFHLEKKPILMIADTTRRAEQIYEEINFFLNNPDQVKLFPDWECLPYDRFSPHQEIISKRLSILADLSTRPTHVLIVTLANLMQKLPPLDYIAAHSFKLRIGDQINISMFRTRLQNAAYLAVSQVMAPGEYAIRGGLLDVFPMGSKAPLRIDLFDEEVETLRYFDPRSQLTTENIDSVELLPAREFPLNDEGVHYFRQQFRKSFEGDPKQQTVYNDVSNHHASPGLEFYFPLFFDETACLFDYLSDNTLIIAHDNLYEQAQIISADIRDRYISTTFDLQHKALPSDRLYLNPNEVKRYINKHKNVVVNRSKSDDAPVNFDTSQPPSLQVNPKCPEPYQKLIDYLKKQTDKKILISAETPGRYEAISSLMAQHEIYPHDVSNWQSFKNGQANLSITVSSIDRGLLLCDHQLEIICETQLYGERSIPTRRTSVKYDPESIIRSLAELNVADPVVHENYGIGRYRGLKAISLDDNTTEFMEIEYQDKAKLYVPVLSLHLISRYTSGSPETAPLHSLGGDQWEKIKKKAQEKAYDVAVELLEVQAIRQSRKGFKFEIAQSEVEIFSSSFDYTETPDQEKAIADVFKDMASKKPMDRLICGDVGFGKTEVAIRAAFVAVYNNKQVVMLVPTTLLAQQHFDTFQNRFAGQAVNIQILSRFKSRKQTKQTVADIASGKADVVIGTHRLLQSDIDIKHFGLLILDEEHRFGVRQKEKLKQLRHDVDILTLTATPIPRTLNQTISSVRDVSIIATPPKDRLSIQTFVREKNNALIKEAIQRELRRGGQVYYLHNEVRTISHQADELKKLIPGITIGIGHGQMPEHQLETHMQNFYHRRFNVFICTTIVESGIDNPAANTIIINRADRFGLAQLHQLRGRVGRSHHQAFAYLLVDSFKSITRDAQKRLDAIASLKELGAGFTIASHDLEIRGAGELLGEAQSGTISQVGFSLYSQYLNQAVKSLNRNINNDLPEYQINNTEIDIQLPALLPQAYIADVHMRLVFYKRIASTVSDQELFDLKVELADRFGFLPEPAKLLLELAQLRPLAQNLGIKRIHLGQNGGYFKFIDEPDFDPVKLINLIQDQNQTYQLKGNGRLAINKDLPEKTDRLNTIKTLLNQLTD